MLSCVRLFMTPWAAAFQTSLSFTISPSLLKLKVPAPYKVSFPGHQPHPKVASQNQSIHITRHLFVFITQKGFQELCARNRDGGQVCTALNHNITSLSSNDFLEIILGDKHSESSISLNIFILPSHRIDSLAEDSLLIILTTLLSFLAFSN